MKTALLVENDNESLDALDRFVRNRNLVTRRATTLDEACKQISRGPVQYAIVDIGLPDGNGLELVDHLPESTSVIAVTGRTDAEAAVDALRARVSDFLTKPLDLERLDRLLTSADEETVKPRRASEECLGAFDKILGESKAIGLVRDQIVRSAPTDASVFICGETGVGKELAARSTHALSPRSSKPFVAVNCGAIPSSLMESELFGHERGSFTGADRQHIGVFERADGGTLFLDEITEMPLELQAKLLRVLETRTIQRIGSTKSKPVDFRLVSASNRPPFQAVEDRMLREDLLYRLLVLMVDIPPLRERIEDLPVLTRSFLAEFDAPGEHTQVSEAALEQLRSHPWPGNVRELRNVVRRAHVMAIDSIEPEHLQMLRPSGSGRRDPYAVHIGQSLEEVERRVILGTLQKNDGDKRRTAEELGVSLKTIYNRLHLYADRGDPLLEPGVIRSRNGG